MSNRTQKQPINIETAKLWLRSNYLDLLASNPDKYFAMLGLLVAFASDHQDVPDAVATLRARVAELEGAIIAHRECIHGADYDYDGDETYQPEAKLYSILKYSGRVIAKAQIAP